MNSAAVLFFLSGALALVYEVLWQRRFALLFGGGERAAAVVLAAYFAGLGAGSYVLGRSGLRGLRPLRAYAILESLVAMGALLSVPLSSAGAGLRVLAADAHGGSAARVGLEAMAALAALALPTFCMGGTLPVLARLAEPTHRPLGVSVGQLYAANTAGSALGALSVPILLLPRLGATGSIGAGAVLSVAVALAAWVLDGRSAPLEAAPGTPRDDGAVWGSWTTPAVALAALSGVVTFVLQVLWTRAFAQVHENSTHSFALVVALFVLALALGAQGARISLGRGQAAEHLIGGAWMVAAVLVAAGPWLFLRLTSGLAYLPAEDGWSRDAPRLALIAAAVVLPAVAAIGVAFPALIEWAARGPGRTSEVVGRVLAANVVGCVAGALLAGFVLPEWTGMWGGMLLAAGALVAGAGGCLARVRARGHGLAIVAALAVVLAAGTVDWPRVRIAEREGERLVALAEGADGIVAVVERPGSRRLKLNNHYVLGGTASLGDERMQAHLPLLLHPSPRRVAVLGVGTGITAGGALFHAFDRLVAVEIVPEVVSAARVHLREANQGVLDDRRTQVVVADARSYLRSTSERFDVVVGDLAVPWRAGDSALFTLEHFAAARRTLAPGGLFCQWLPLFQLSEAELHMVLRTFLHVFPRAQLWRGDFAAGEPALALVASAEPIGLDPARVEAGRRSTSPDPANPHLASPAGVWMYFAGVVDAADVPAGDGRLNREDRPWLELLGPWNAGASRRLTGRRLQAWLREMRERATPRLEALGPAEIGAMEAGEWLYEFSLALAEKNPEAARSAQARLRTLLPPETFLALFPAP